MMACRYRPEAINCMNREMTNCPVCGWNPKVEAQRKAGAPVKKAKRYYHTDEEVRLLCLEHLKEFGGALTARALAEDFRVDPNRIRKIRRELEAELSKAVKVQGGNVNGMDGT